MPAEYNDEDDDDRTTTSGRQDRTRYKNSRESRQGGSCLRYATTVPQGVATLVDAPCLKASSPLLSASSFPLACGNASEQAANIREKETTTTTTMDQTEEEVEKLLRSGIPGSAAD